MGATMDGCFPRARFARVGLRGVMCGQSPTSFVRVCCIRICVSYVLHARGEDDDRSYNKITHDTVVRESIEI